MMKRKRLESSASLRRFLQKPEKLPVKIELKRCNLGSPTPWKTKKFLTFEKMWISYTRSTHGRVKHDPKVILLMVQKSGFHQLRLVVYPIIYGVFTSQVVVWDFFHQQYQVLLMEFVPLEDGPMSDSTQMPHVCFRQITGDPFRSITGSIRTPNPMQLEV